VIDHQQCGACCAYNARDEAVFKPRDAQREAKHSHIHVLIT
jgi:hypothetical protein